jgi:RNA polymerase sigma-B factor
MSKSTTTRDLARQDDEELLLTYRDERASDARDELVRRFIPFARKLALRYAHSREPLDELVQVASMGLLKALERFEPGRGKKFTAYAAPTVLGELKRDLRDKGWSVHVPRDVQERALAVSRQSARLSAAPITSDADDYSPLAETLGVEDSGFELAEERQALATGWATLDNTERQVLGLRLVHELTQREISQRIGCSQMHLSRLLRRSIIRLDAAATPV